MMQADVEHRLYVDGEDWGLFDTYGGGGRQWTNVKRRHGGQQQETLHKGRSRLAQVTLGRDYQPARDHAKLRRLQTHNGPALSARLVSTELDDDGNPFGTPTTQTGAIASVTPGDTDANNDALRDWSFVMDVERSE